jgi:hypothetical protein
MKHFAEIERMRRRSETNLRAYSARDKMQEAAEQEKVRSTTDYCGASFNAFHYVLVHEIKSTCI